MYQNPIYGIINQNYVQEQLQRQYHNVQMYKSFDCARKLDDFFRSIDEIAPEYQQIVCDECCAVIGKYLRKHGVI